MMVPTEQLQDYVMSVICAYQQAAQEEEDELRGYGPHRFQVRARQGPDGPLLGRIVRNTRGEGRTL
jgi:hypothetical protein